MNVAIDVETTMMPKFLPWIDGSELVCISTCSDSNETKTWWFYHDIATKSYRESVEEINEYLKQFDRVIAHNLKFDLQWLAHMGINLSQHKLYCTMVAEYLIRGQARQEGLTLNDLGEHYNIPKKKDKVKVYWDAGIDTPDIPADILQTYCEQDAVNALAIFRRQVNLLKVRNLTTLLALEMEVLVCFAEMEKNGMRMNPTLLTFYQKEYSDKLDVLDEELRDLLGIDNIGSGDQLSAALFGGILKKDGKENVKKILKSGEVKTYERKCVTNIPMVGLGFIPKTLGIAETKKEGIYETNVVALMMLKPKTPDQKQCVKLLGERSRISTMKTMYFDGLLKALIGEYVHPNINQALTKTGRTSCARPNLQNQPQEGTGPVKMCFITRY